MRPTWCPPRQRAKGKGKVSNAEAAPADVAGAQAALDRITVTQEARERISAAVLPGSSLIISDEGLHGETGKDTDFIVVMSGDPQGGLMSRHKPSHKGMNGADGFFGGFSRAKAGGAAAVAADGSFRNRPAIAAEGIGAKVQASVRLPNPAMNGGHALALTLSLRVRLGELAA